MSWLIAAALLVALIAAYGQWRYGSVKAPFTLLRGDSLFVVSVAVVRPDAQNLNERDIVLVLKNIGTGTISVTGYRSTCTCVALSGLPATLLPNGEKELTLRIRGIGNLGPSSYKAVLYVTGQTTSEVSVSVPFEATNRAPRYHATSGSPRSTVSARPYKDCAASAGTYPLDGVTT